jgi:ectoine hydroxylase-related dioxygenase (phytanoyl-CoA dioxygenase family)
MGTLPGHVRCAVPAGAMILFDMRTWHTGLPNTNGENRENMIFTYGGVAPGAIDSGEANWPTGFYGGPPVEQDGKMFNKNFLECGKELDAMGRLDTPLRRQMLGVELTHPEAKAVVNVESEA